MRKVNFFKNFAGECPVEEFLDNLSAKQAQKIIWVMKLVEEIKKVPEIYLKKLTNTNDIWEIRVQASPGIIRVLGFFEGNNFVATNGFAKKSQKTPLREINLAEKRKNEYVKRGEKNE